jgi:hypothetical protein
LNGTSSLNNFKYSNHPKTGLVLKCRWSNCVLKWNGPVLEWWGVKMAQPFKTRTILDKNASTIRKLDKIVWFFNGWAFLGSHLVLIYKKMAKIVF